MSPSMPTKRPRPPPPPDPPPPPVSDAGGSGWSGPINRTIGALAGTPMLLTLALLNVAMFGMVTYLIIKSADYRFAERQEIIKLFADCMRQQKLDRNMLFAPDLLDALGPKNAK